MRITAFATDPAGIPSKTAAGLYLLRIRATMTDGTIVDTWKKLVLTP